MAAKKKGARARAKGKAAPTIDQRMKLLQRQQHDTVAQLGRALERIGKLEQSQQDAVDTAVREMEDTLQAQAFARRARMEGCGIAIDFDPTEPPKVPWWQRLFNSFGRGAAQAG